MYPHSITGVLATKRCNTIRRNAVVLALYTIMLGLLARLGYVAIKAGTIPVGLVGTIDPQLVMPQLFPDNFPRWFAGIAQTAIGAGSIMPVAINAFIGDFNDLISGVINHIGVIAGTTRHQVSTCATV